MRLLLPAIFLAVPLIEIALFVVIGGQIGVLPTMALVIMTAFLGTILLRRQGFAVLDQTRRALEQGRMPLGAVADGLFLLAAGLLLLTPGFFTDFIGFLLFVPRIRAILGRFALTLLLDRNVASARRGPRAGRDGGGPITIEGEVIERSDTPSDGENRNH